MRKFSTAPFSEKIKLSAPWVTYFNKVKALFGDDPEINVEYAEDNNGPIINIEVANEKKANAIRTLVPEEVPIGNIIIKIFVYSTENNLEGSTVDLIRTAFEGNPALSRIVTIGAGVIFTNPVSYVAFKNKVVQFWNDDLSDINGNYSTLYQNLAEEIIGQRNGIMYCTDPEEE